MPKDIVSETTLVAAKARLRNRRSGSIGRACATPRRGTHEQEASDGQGAEDLGRAPARAVPAHDAPDHAEQAARREHEPERVEAFARAVALGQEGARERQDDDPERDVQPEDPLPGDAVDDGAADERPERDREPRDARPDAERDAAALGGEGRCEQGQAERKHHRRARALDARAATSSPEPGDSAAAAEASVNSAIPTSKIRRRPKRSPRAAPGSKSTAKLSV